MSKPCPVCASADPVTRAKIESLRETGESFRAIAALVDGFDKFQIQRHFRHIGKAVAAISKLSPLEQSELRLSELASRAEESWVAAASSGDAKVAIDILKSQIRLELDRHSRLVDAQEQQEIADEADPLKTGAPSVAFCDHLMQSVREQEKQYQIWGWVKCPCCWHSGAWVAPARIQERMADIQRAASQGANANSNISATSN
jgi:hypothetical protein